MGFIYGLAVVLVIFQGIIIQCEGGRRKNAERGESSRGGQNAQEQHHSEQNDRFKLIKANPDVKELDGTPLELDLIREDQLEDIFKINKKITAISLTKPNRRETMQSMSEHLTKLDFFRVENPGQNFLYRPPNYPVYKLLEVTSFVIKFDNFEEVFGTEIGYPSFEVPKLLKLTLSGNLTDNIYDYQLIEFTAHFQTLEKVIFILPNDPKVIQKLIHNMIATGKWEAKYRQKDHTKASSSVEFARL